MGDVSGGANGNHLVRAHSLGSSHGTEAGARAPLGSISSLCVARVAHRRDRDRGQRQAIRQARRQRGCRSDLPMTARSKKAPAEAGATRHQRSRLSALIVLVGPLIEVALAIVTVRSGPTAGVVPVVMSRRRVALLPLLPA